MLLAASLIQAGSAAHAEGTQRAPDILVVGDSQLTFGAGVAFVDFFDDAMEKCGIADTLRTGVIGVRSSSLAAFTARSGSAKGPVCDVDPKWKVNAGAYGVLSPGKNPYIQIGQGASFQFCRKGLSPFEAMFQGGYYRPRLLVMFFLGNGSDKWVGNVEAAAADVRDMMRDLPAGLPCIFMTTAPTYGHKTVKLRQRAQESIEAAFSQTGSNCSFVRGYTAATIAQNVGNPDSFRRRPNGEVKDPYHPTEASARRFLSLLQSDLCKAVKTQLPGQ
jgi:hypothetical protein